MSSIVGIDLNKKYVILKKNDYSLLPECYQRVFYCNGGFGCNPQSLGSAVFGKLIFNGDTSIRAERYEIERLATEEEIKKALEEYEKSTLIKMQIENDILKKMEEINYVFSPSCLYCKFSEPWVNSSLTGSCKLFTYFDMKEQAEKYLRVHKLGACSKFETDFTKTKELMINITMMIQQK